MNGKNYYFAVIREEKVEFCKGIENLCTLLSEGYLPVLYGNNLQQLFTLMSDYY